jgi:hypothetical protein
MHVNDTEKELQFHKEETARLNKIILDATSKAMMQDSKIFEMETLV